jgi:hypothetical protein
MKEKVCYGICNKVICKIPQIGDENNQFHQNKKSNDKIEEKLT